MTSILAVYCLDSAAPVFRDCCGEAEASDETKVSHYFHCQLLGLEGEGMSKGTREGLRIPADLHRFRAHLNTRSGSI